MMHDNYDYSEKNPQELHWSNWLKDSTFQWSLAKTKHQITEFLFNANIDVKPSGVNSPV